MAEATQAGQDGQTQAYALAAKEELLRDQAGVSFEAMASLGVRILSEFGQAENDRRLTELRWLQDIRQYRGQYDPEVLAAIGPNRSRAFVRKTRVKVKTVDSRMADLLFPANAERNFTLSPTPVPSIPEGVEKRLAGMMARQLKREPSKEEIKQVVKKLTNDAATAMGNTIDDQLVEARYKDVARQVIHSGNLYGTGVLKAPLVERKVRQSFVRGKGGKWELKTESYVVPFVDFVPLWRFYPDMAATVLEDCRYVFERHVMTKAGMLKLAERKSFNRQKIIDYVAARPDGEVQAKYYDAELMSMGDRTATAISKTGQYDVIERWGWVDAQSLVDCGLTIPAERMHETFFANVWILPSGEVIRAVLQPINGVTWPYHLYHFDKDETSIFAEGLAAVMRGDQTMLNASVRMILDNAALTAGPQLEVNTRLVGGNAKIHEMFPFKVWPRTGEDPGSPAIRVIEVPNHIAELSSLVTMFENNADEVTAIPRYMSGENATNGAAGTASGMSMLMGAASIVMKDLISSFDEGITKPFIEALYRWNMQFNKDDSIKGDFDVAASGTSSMVAKEVRAQQLDQFSQMAGNPLDAPYIKREELLRQRAHAHDLSDVIKTDEEVAAEQNNPQTQQAQQLQQAQQQLQMQTMQAQLDKLLAEVAKTRAQAVEVNVASAYAAMQAGGVAVQSPNVAPAGDEILRSAGWQDATPQETNTQAVGPDPQPMAQAPNVQAQPDSAGPEVGMTAGMRTDRLNG